MPSLVLMLLYLRRKDPGDSGLCGLCGDGGQCVPGSSSLSLVVTMVSESRLTHRDGLELVRGDGDSENSLNFPLAADR